MSAGIQVFKKRHSYIKILCLMSIKHFRILSLPLQTEREVEEDEGGVEHKIRSRFMYTHNT